MKINIKILVGVVLFLFVALVIYLFTLTKIDKPQTNLGQEIAVATSSDSSNKTFTIADVATHATAEDCWVIIRGSIYDLTPFTKKHPGGIEPILNSCGKDGTKTFETRNQEPARPHSEENASALIPYLVGVVN